MSPLRAILLALAVGLAAPVTAGAQEATEMQAHFGELNFRLFCAGCHGPDGRGDRDFFEALQMPVVDLTVIGQRAEGPFPREEIAAAIAGTSDVRGHRRLSLPAWAEVFADDFGRFAEQAAVDPMVARRIAHLVAYIESIQR